MAPTLIPGLHSFHGLQDRGQLSHGNPQLEETTELQEQKKTFLKFT